MNLVKLVKRGLRARARAERGDARRSRLRGAPEDARRAQLVRPSKASKAAYVKQLYLWMQEGGQVSASGHKSGSAVQQARQDRADAPGHRRQTPHRGSTSFFVLGASLALPAWLY